MGIRNMRLFATVYYDFLAKRKCKRIVCVDNFRTLAVIGWVGGQANGKARSHRLSSG